MSRLKKISKNNMREKNASESVDTTYKVICNSPENGSKWYEEFTNENEAEQYAIEQMWQDIYVRINVIHSGLDDF